MTIPTNPGDIFGNPHWTSIIYANGNFLAISSYGVSGYSLNGIDWTLPTDNQGNVVPNMPSGDWTSVAYGNGIYVAVGGLGGAKAAYSNDGMTWTESIVIPNVYGNSTYGFFTSIAFAGSFYAVSSQGHIVSSADGINWSLEQNLPISYSWTYAYSIPNSSMLFVLSNSDKILYKGSGSSPWVTVYSMPSIQNWTSIIYVDDGANTGFYATATGLPKVVRSQNFLLDWTETTLPSEHLISLAYTKGINGNTTRLVALAAGGPGSPRSTNIIAYLTLGS